MVCDVWGMPCEELAMPRSLLFAGYEVPSGWEEDGGMRLAGLDARRLFLRIFDN